MSFFKRMLSSIGIGSAKVDTILDQDTFAPGDMMEGVVEVKGGSTEQQIDGLYFSVQCTYEATVEYTEVDEDGEEETTEEDVTRTAVLCKAKLKESFVIGPGEKEEIPVEILLPYSAPLTIGKTKVWLHTGLDIDKGLDAGDRDYIQVVPGPLVGALFDALENLGFRMVEAGCEEVPGNFHSNLPFVQEFEFKPMDSEFRGRLDELELVCFPDENEVEVFMEIDRKARGLRGFVEEMLGTDESHIKFTITESDLPELTDLIYNVIDSKC